MIKQADMKIKNQFEIVNSLEGRNASLTNDIFEMKIIVKNTKTKVQKVKLRKCQ